MGIFGTVSPTNICNAFAVPSATESHIINDFQSKHAVRDYLASIDVQLKDAMGLICEVRSCPLSVTILTPHGHPLHNKIFKRDCGVFEIKYFPVEEGPHFLDISIGKLSISGCPRVIHVRNALDYSIIGLSGPKFTFGGYGTENGKFNCPWGICCDLKGRIIVADRLNNRIQIFDKDGNYLKKFGIPGNGPGQFNHLVGVAVNSLNQIIVSDKDNHRIEIFDEDGNYVFEFGRYGNQFGGYFLYPWGVAINKYTDDIAICDSKSQRIQVFSSDGEFKYHLYGAYCQLQSPRGICYTSDGRMLVTDFNNHRLAEMPSLHSPYLMKCYGAKGVDVGFYWRPQGIATDQMGNILICDSRNSRIQVMNGDEMTHLASFGNWNSTSKTSSLLFTPRSIKFPYLPTDICVSPDGNIYVTDSNNSVVNVY